MQAEPPAMSAATAVAWRPGTVAGCSGRAGRGRGCLGWDTTCMPGNWAGPAGDPGDDFDHVVEVALGIGAAGDGQTRSVAAGASVPSGRRPNITVPTSQARTPPSSYSAQASAWPRRAAQTSPAHPSASPSAQPTPRRQAPQQHDKQRGGVDGCVVDAAAAERE